MEPDANCNVAYIMHGERLSCKRIPGDACARLLLEIAANRRGEATDGSRRVAVYRRIEREETASTAQPRYWKGVRARVHARIIIDPWIEMKRSGNPE